MLSMWHGRVADLADEKYGFGHDVLRYFGHLTFSSL
jgi:hypothetical protein